MDLAKIQEGKFSFNFEYFDLKKLVKSCVDQVDHMASQKSIMIETIFLDLRPASVGVEQESLETLLKDVYGDQRRFI